MAQLPASGIISGSQVGVYVFNRTSTTEFSLSASLAGSTVSKGYTTTLGPLWRGTGTGDTNNQQYNQGANNFSLSDWYNYAKGYEINVSPQERSAGDACNSATEVPAYVTDVEYWGGTGGALVVGNLTVGYSNTSGTTILPQTIGIDEYRKVFENNAAFQIDADGVFVNEISCP
jgi:hypothetical protein